jgi:hypothetical protein
MRTRHAPGQNDLVKYRGVLAPSSGPSMPTILKSAIGRAAGKPAPRADTTMIREAFLGGSKGPCSQADAGQQLSEKTCVPL